MLNSGEFKTGIKCVMCGSLSLNVAVNMAKPDINIPNGNITFNLFEKNSATNCAIHAMVSNVSYPFEKGNRPAMIQRKTNK